MGVSVALLTLSAMIVVPLGPVPFTLQTMMLAMLPLAVGGRTATLSVALYLLLGTIGMPVFSGLSGGPAHLLGPTGGYLWGFLAGTALGEALRPALPPGRCAEAACAGVMLLTSYAAGTVQLSMVMGVSLSAASSIAVLPFIGPDVIKLAAGLCAGRVIRAALDEPGRQTR